MDRCRAAFFVALGIVLSVSTARGNYLLLSQPTDTIQIPGNTVASTAFTIEARIEILSSLPTQSERGRIFQEQRDNGEDKSLGINSGGQIGASAWTDATYDTLGAIVQNAMLSKDVWHHVAFVRDGTEQRLYVDGLLVASNTWTAPISNVSNSGMSVGGFSPPTVSPFRASFLGAVDTVRVSASVEYSGESFAPPPGDLSPDSSTQLLYNFNEAPLSTTVSDLGPNHLTGTLGVGYLGATSPTLVDFLPGDANGDGKVDISDLLTLANNWQTSGHDWAEADFTGDGIVDGADLAVLASNWQAGVNSPMDLVLARLGLPQLSVPEPAITLLMCSALLLRRRFNA
jgi:hypothetical protein